MNHVMPRKRRLAEKTSTEAANASTWTSAVRKNRDVSAFARGDAFW